MSEVRFADPADGWVFGPDLWSSHNGGTSWTRVNLGAGAQVEALEAAGGTVDAVVAIAWSANAGPCPASLETSPVGTDRSPVNRAISLPAGVPGAALALHAHTGY